MHILSPRGTTRGRAKQTTQSVFKWFKAILKMEENDPSKKDEKEDEKNRKANQEKKDEKEEESDKDQTPTRAICPLSGNPKR